jgi:hypothetical protein
VASSPGELRSRNHLIPPEESSRSVSESGKLSGYPNKAAGRYEQAAADARKAIEFDPDSAYVRGGLSHKQVHFNGLTGRLWLLSNRLMLYLLVGVGSLAAGERRLSHFDNTTL